ncbi:helix-turn-helix domain-containing protein [Candidatus Margulisiibacteriota bacterium]
MEINENEVYTTKEVQGLLKISQATLMRLLKKGALKAAKVGHQHRFLGKELLRFLSPDVEEKVGQVYVKAKKKLKKILEE